MRSASRRATAHERNIPVESISWLIERVTFFNEENGLLRPPA
jgi:hypothetical protein